MQYNLQVQMNQGFNVEPFGQRYLGTYCSLFLSSQLSTIFGHSDGSDGSDRCAFGQIRRFGHSDELGYEGGGLEIFVYGSEGVRPDEAVGTVYALTLSRQGWLRVILMLRWLRQGKRTVRKFGHSDLPNGRQAFRTLGLSDTDKWSG